MKQVRWLINQIQDNCTNVSSFGKYVTIDEMMIQYKGCYCLTRQYMSKKPQNG